MTETIESYIARNQLEMTVTRVPARPGCSGMGRGASHYLCVIKQAGKGNPAQVACFYSMGSAHKVGPQLPEVLDSLASDASGTDEQFTDWCDNYGYDSDSRKAEAIYRACAENAAKLLALLGRAEYNVLLNNVERL